MDIAPSWAAYARLQQKLSNTFNTELAAALESGLSIILDRDCRIEAIDDVVLQRAVSTAARTIRYRARLRRRYQDDLGGWHELDEAEDVASATHASCGFGDVHDAVHAKRELERIESLLNRTELSILMDIAAGVPYDEVARANHSSAGALRTRVARLRALLAEPQPHRRCRRNVWLGGRSAQQIRRTP